MAYDALSDETLIQRVGRRDAAALSTLYDRYARQAHAVALLITREPAAATAVVEELFWRVWRQGQPPSSGATVRNSLMLSARRLAESAPSPRPSPAPPAQSTRLSPIEPSIR
jgi:DNA-directed RNA polymerase specialized sigma24 family protein